MQGAFLCVGAAHWDVIGRTSERLGPGADVPGRVVRRPGGVALNIALALATLGRKVALLAALGRDAAGEELAALAEAAGIDCAGLARRDHPTDLYLAIEDRGGELHAAVADCTGLERAGASLLDALGDGRLPVPWPGRVVADGNLPEAVVEALLGVHATAGAPVALVPASPRKARDLLRIVGGRPVAIYLNRLEAEAACARGFPDSRSAALALRDRGVPEVVVTDGARAATAAGAEGVLALVPPAVVTRSLTGAGDRFVAAHLAARADGLGPEAALRAALAASARHIAFEVP